MDLRNLDFQITGVSDMPFEACLLASKQMDEQYHLWRFITWDFEGQPNTTVCDEGTSILELDAILEYDVDRIRNFSCEYDLLPSAPPCRLDVSRGSGTQSDIAGYLPISEAIHPCTTTSLMSAALLEYGDFVLNAARALRSRVLTVASEWCEESFGTHDVVLPTLLCVLESALVRDARAALRHAGAVLDAERDGLVRVWMQSVEAHVEGREPDPRALEIVSRILS